MSMPLGFATKVSLFSMRKRIIRTILALLPCVLLIAVMFIGSTIPNGLVNELDAQVLSKAQERQEYVSLGSYLFSQQDMTKISTVGSTTMYGPSSFTFNQENYDKATQSPYVESVFPQQGSVTGVVQKIGNVEKPSVMMDGVSAEYAKLFSPELFVYTKGQPIPVLINPLSINGTSYNWGDKSTLEIDYSKPDEANSRQAYTQLKDADKLIGTTFTADFGAFPNWPQAFEEQTLSNYGPPKSKLTKLTDGDKEVIIKRLKEVYGAYWDVEKLSQPIAYQFKIVGLLDTQSSSAVVVPNEAIPAIWNQVYARQLAARTTKAVDKELLASETNKIEVVGGFVQDGSQFGSTSLTWQKDPSVSVWQMDISQVGIPALLVETTKNAKGQSEYSMFSGLEITERNFRKTGAIVKLKSADDREAYIKYLKDNNMMVIDNSPLAVIKGVRKGATIFVTWLTIILGTGVAFILLTTVSRFVADSRKEIGVWRAIGAKRIDITVLVLVRMSILLLFGIAVGVAIGYGVSALIAKSIVSSVNGFTGDINVYAPGGGNFIGSIIVSMLGGQVPKLSIIKLLDPNWQLLGSRLGVLAVISLVVGLIPAARAARISPVTAIRDSE